MNRTEKEVLIEAIEGLESGDYIKSLEKIMTIITCSTKQSAYTKALDVRAEVKGLVTTEDINLKDYKARYGYYKGYPVIQLALDFFQMSNDLFFEKYHFNYVPSGKVFSEVKQLISDIQFKNSVSDMYSKSIEYYTNQLGATSTIRNGVD